MDPFIAFSILIGGYAVDTQRTVALRPLADKCEHRLFFSATPTQRPP
jgi:hypothetical protein